MMAKISAGRRVQRRGGDGFAFLRGSAAPRARTNATAKLLPWCIRSVRMQLPRARIIIGSAAIAGLCGGVSIAYWAPAGPLLVYWLSLSIILGIEASLTRDQIGRASCRERV